MRSERAKVLHELGGEPMLLRALRAVAALAPAPLCVVVGHQAREVEALARAAFPNSADLAFALQAEQRGTGHATRCGIAAIARDFDRRFVQFHRQRLRRIEENLQDAESVMKFVLPASPLRPRGIMRRVPP